MLIVRTNTEKNDGICYVETKSLDGETNLKQKKATPDLNEVLTHDNEQEFLQHVKGKITCDAPNCNLYKAMITHAPNEKTKNKYDVSNVAWRGMILKKTASVVGIVIYTGHETTI